MLSRRRAPSDHAGILRDWLSRPRYEVLPVPGIVDRVADHLTTPATLTVTASPRHGMAATLDVAASLADLGHAVVPHIAARQLVDEVELKEVVDQVSRSGIDEIFVVAGDTDPPAGLFSGAVDLLESLSRIAPDLRVGVTGYPESHPRIPDDVAVQAMWDKRHHASYVVSQICFDAKTVVDWTRRLRARGIVQPVLVGMPGPITTGRLLQVGRRIGVGESLRFLTGHRELARLARPGPWDPLPLLHQIAGRLDEDGEGLGVAGLHLYTFNAVAETEQWRRTQLDMLGEPAGRSHR